MNTSNTLAIPEVPSFIKAIISLFALADAQEEERKDLEEKQADERDAERDRLQAEEAKAADEKREAEAEADRKAAEEKDAAVEAARLDK